MYKDVTCMTTEEGGDRTCNYIGAVLQVEMKGH